MNATIAPDLDAPYLRAYGLDEHPFRLAPNAKYAFKTAITSQALTYGRSVITGRQGLGCISGEIGTGKTTIAGILAREAMASGHRVASLYRLPGGVRHTEASILLEINRDLGIEEAERQTAKRSMSKLERYAYECRAKARALIIIIDEAHQLRAQGIATLLALLAITTDKEPLIQVMLFGQSPEMMQAIKGNRALHSRLTDHTELQLLNEIEIESMLNHRLGAAGRTQQTFILTAMRKIARYSKGVPRIACTLAHCALLTAFERDPSGCSMVFDFDVDTAAERLSHE